MHRVTKGITAAATSAILIAGLIVISARSARAQQNDDATQYEGAHGAAGVSAEPDTKAPPIDVNGCWSGTLSDVYAGSGDGYLSFDQTTTKKGQLKKKLKAIKSSSTHNIYVVWSDTSCAYGYGPGTATSTGFHEN